MSSQVLKHEPPGEGGGGQGRRHRKWHGNVAVTIRCSSLFLEPLKWMEDVEKGGNDGKLSCYKCKTRLGHFSWSGAQCSCTHWVTPAFQLHKSKVDIVKSS